MIFSILNKNIASLLFAVFASTFALINASYAASPSVCIDNTPGQIVDRYTDLGDGTALDSLTGLIWQRCNLSQTWNTTTESCQSFTKTNTWRASLVEIQNYNSNQFALGLPDTWRMPNIKELASIINLSCVNFALDGEIFPSAETRYWSSTPNAALINETEIVDGNGVATGYQDENFVWIINTLTGRDENIGVSSSIATLLVRNPINP